jgi:ubiquinone/menaquinone biosynthesis C-methylase UbiE
MNAIEWYNSIAKRNGGYKYNVPYVVEGLSAEDVFCRELSEIIPGKAVLDAGCGHGAFTLEMAKSAAHITGYDFAEELVKIAQKLKTERQQDNADFLLTVHGQNLPFAEESLDVIYSRRGPTSAAAHGRLLKPGGVILGIHQYPSEGRDMAEYLASFGFYSDITVRVFSEAITFFANPEDYAEYLSSSHLSPDYTLPENREAFEAILRESYIDGRIGIRESKQIWRAIKR